jgi:hypothetical protein
MTPAEISRSIAGKVEAVEAGTREISAVLSGRIPFPSWFMRITCDRCGKDRMLAETHAPRSDLPIREIIKRMRHDGCDGRPGRVELLSGLEGASSRPVRRIVLIAG